MRIVLIIIVFCLLSRSSLKSNNDSCIKYVVVTQKTSRVFGGASDRKVDRIRLRKAAEWKILALHGVSNSTNNICGMRIEKMTYIPSNRVEAVFSYSLVRPNENS